MSRDLTDWPRERCRKSHVHNSTLLSHSSRSEEQPEAIGKTCTDVDALNIRCNTDLEDAREIQASTRHLVFNNC